MRELIHQFKWQTLVLFKCLLLQPKVTSSTDIPEVDSADAVLDALLWLEL